MVSPFVVLVGGGEVRPEPCGHVGLLVGGVVPASGVPVAGVGLEVGGQGLEQAALAQRLELVVDGANLVREGAHDARFSATGSASNHASKSLTPISVLLPALRASRSPRLMALSR